MTKVISFEFERVRQRYLKGAEGLDDAYAESVNIIISRTEKHIKMCFETCEMDKEDNREIEEMRLDGLKTVPLDGKAKMEGRILEYNTERDKALEVRVKSIVEEAEKILIDSKELFEEGLKKSLDILQVANEKPSDFNP